MADDCIWKSKGWGMRAPGWKLLAVVALAASVGLSVTGIAGAAQRAETTVTIKAEGLDLSGQVKSPRPLRCAEGRKVVVFKVRPGDDLRFATDNASLNGDRYEWSTGNTGTQGRFYAKAPRTDRCQADTSRTVRAEPQ